MNKYTFNNYKTKVKYQFVTNQYTYRFPAVYKIYNALDVPDVLVVTRITSIYTADS